MNRAERNRRGYRRGYRVWHAGHLAQSRSLPVSDRMHSYTHLTHCRSVRHSAATFAPWWSRAVRKHAPEYPAGSTRGRRPRRGTGKTGTRGRTSAESSRSSAASCAYSLLHHYTRAPTHQQTRRVYHHNPPFLLHRASQRSTYSRLHEWNPNFSRPSRFGGFDYTIKVIPLRLRAWRSAIFDGHLYETVIYLRAIYSL